MGNLLIDHSHLQRVDVFVLARDEHASDADNVQVGDLPPFVLILKVAIQERDSQEEGLIVALKVCEHLNHPVDHASTQGWRDLVLDEAVVSEVLQLELPHVGHH